LTPPEIIKVCKVGPAGTYNFTYTRNEAVGTSLITSPFTVEAGECVDIFAGGATAEHGVFSEVSLPAGTAVDYVVVQGTVDRIRGDRRPPPAPALLEPQS
jgi:hypothetical protein